MTEIQKERELIRQLAEINRAAVPGRVLFGRGAGARGIFQPYMTMRDYTAAHFLSDPEQETPVFVRFAKAMDTGGESGRDVREFAVRFYTEQGNFDLFLYSLPVFCIADPQKLPVLLRALAREPESNLHRPEQLWKFSAANPESMNMLLRLYSDSGTLKSYRTMPGYAPFTLCSQNRKGDEFFVRFHLKPFLGVRTISRREAEFLAGFDGDAASRDLYETLREGKAVEYELSVQIVPRAEERRYPFSLLDPTKIWPEDLIPPVQIGKIKLTDNINNYLNDVEKAELSPANLVQGIDFAGEPLLPALSFFIEDGCRRRLSADSALQPVNQKKQGKSSGRGGCRTAADQYGGVAERIAEQKTERSTERNFERSTERNSEYVTARNVERQRRQVSVGDVYSQAGDYYDSLTGRKRLVLADNIAESMMFLDSVLQEEMTRHFFAVSPELGGKIAKSLAF